MAYSKMIINNYPMYGLNHNRSFLRPPKCADGNGYIILKTQDELDEFASEILIKHKCSNPALFIVYNDGRMGAYTTMISDDEIQVRYLQNECDLHFFAKLDGECRFCCYNLIIEEKPGMWMIQE